MNFTEKDLEEMIWRAAETDAGRGFLMSRGLSIFGTMFRQVGLGNYGVADLITVYATPKRLPTHPQYHQWEIDIYELKREEIGNKALGQALRYKDAINYFIRKYDLKIAPVYHIHLVGSAIDTSNDFLPMIRSCTVDVTLYTYLIDYDGLRFEHTDAFDYSATNPGNLSAKVSSKEALRSVLAGSCRHTDHAL